MVLANLPEVVRKLLLLQIMLTVTAAVLAAALGSSHDWRAALAGGGIVVAATLVAARRAFSAGPGSSPEQIMVALMRGQVLKMIFIAVAVLACMKLMQGGYLVLMATLFTTLLAHHFALLWIVKSQSRDQG